MKKEKVSSTPNLRAGVNGKQPLWEHSFFRRGVGRVNSGEGH